MRVTSYGVRGETQVMLPFVNGLCVYVEHRLHHSGYRLKSRLLAAAEHWIAPRIFRVSSRQN